MEKPLIEVPLAETHLKHLIRKYELMIKNINEAKVRHIANHDNSTPYLDGYLSACDDILKDLKNL